LLGVGLGVTLGALARLLPIFALALAACTGPAAVARRPPVAPRPPPAPAAWPAFPVSVPGAQELLAAHTRRPARTEPVLTRELLEASLRAAARANQLVAGDDAIGAFLRARTPRQSFVLFGTYHDAPAQIVAFRRLAGALGFGATDAVIEQFHAAGRWSGVPAQHQAGDGAALVRGAGLGGVIASQRDHDHAAWKYDYLEELPALVATLQAGGVRVHGCDLPTSLQARARSVGDVSLTGLRELHCVLALAEQVRPPSKVAMLWGARHVAADGVQRFLPPDATVIAIEVFGGRPAGDGVEGQLGFRLAGPVLFPVPGRDRFALVLPAGALAVRVDRARTALSAGEPTATLRVSSETELELWLDGSAEPVGDKPRDLPLAAGQHAFLARDVAGGVRVPEGGFTELHLAGGEVRIVEHRPAP